MLNVEIKKRDMVFFDTYKDKDNIEKEGEIKKSINSIRFDVENLTVSAKGKALDGKIYKIDIMFPLDETFIDELSDFVFIMRNSCLRDWCNDE